MSNWSLKRKILVIGLLTIIGVTVLFSYWPKAAQAGIHNLRWAELDLYTDHHHAPPTPYLYINFTTGQAGSFFYIYGHTFPNYNKVNITVNGTYLGDLYADEYGNIEFELSTTDADEGHYFVTVAVDSNAEINDTVHFEINADAPLRDSTEIPDTFSVPTGIAYTDFIYLPLILR
jgi:hypothetical protein